MNHVDRAQHAPWRTILPILCGVVTLFATTSWATLPSSANGWGYPYDSLKRDLATWRASPYVRIDSIGASVQNRALWMVSITDSTDSLAAVPGRPGPKRRIVMHARTHPREVQAEFVANEIVKFLLDSSTVSRNLRRDFIVNILPQYNPDGVALTLDRWNANMVDIESNWSQGASMQPEPVALKKQFLQMMSGQIPVEVALNLHSDELNGARFFFYHEVGGTSPSYTWLEKVFIEDVQSHFAGGIKNWNFITSWISSTPSQYPESFWWQTSREKVLALTYEDINDTSANFFDSTGHALILGAADYLRTKYSSIQPKPIHESRVGFSRDGVRIRMDKRGSWIIVDVQGRRWNGGSLGIGETLLDWNSLGRNTIRILIVEPEGEAPEQVAVPLGRQP